MATPTIKSVPDYKGTFTQGTNGSLILVITNFLGNPVNANSISLSVTDSSGALIFTNVPEKVSNGFYVYEWSIPSNLTPGKYIVTWSYATDEGSFTEVQSVQVAQYSASVAQSDTLYSSYVNDLRTALSYLLGCAQAVPVYFEQSLPSKDNKTFRFTFPRWNQSSGIRIYRNKKNVLVTENFEINYFTGEVIFDSALTEFDRIYADYNFRWFSDEELYSFLQNGLNTLNVTPPASPIYTFGTLPTRWTTAVIKYAAADALRKLLLCLNFQEPQQVFGGSEAAQQVFGNLETLKKNYEEDYKYLFEQKKYGPYPSVYSISVPEYTLPGGRSRWFRMLFTGTAGT